MKNKHLLLRCRSQILIQGVRVTRFVVVPSNARDSWSLLRTDRYCWQPAMHRQIANRVLHKIQVCQASDEVAGQGGRETHRDSRPESACIRDVHSSQIPTNTRLALLAVKPLIDQAPGDRYPIGQLWKTGAQLFARKPARVFQLSVIELDVV